MCHIMGHEVTNVCFEGHLQFFSNFSHTDDLLAQKNTPSSHRWGITSPATLSAVLVQETCTSHLPAAATMRALHGFICCLALTEIIAAVSQKTVLMFAQTGSSVLLRVEIYEENDMAEWKIGNQVIYNQVKSFSPLFKEKVELEGNNSLRVKNLTFRDSGEYVYAQTKDWTTTVVKYHLFVQEAVPSPILAVVKLHASPDCSFTVNCSVPGGWIGCSSNETQCWSSPPSMVSMSVQKNHSHIECVASNNVSSSSSCRSLEELCSPQNSTGSTPQKPSEEALKIAGSCCAAVVLLVCAALIGTRCRQSRRKDRLLENAAMPAAETTGAAPPASTIYSVVNKAAYLPTVPVEVHRVPRNKGCPVDMAGDQGPENDVSTVYCLASKTEEQQRPPEVSSGSDAAQPNTIYYTLGQVVPKCK
ncbi:uncharacterized protein LOC114774343 [Denticeps clupeoides]|uniref:uncharacterized protein LOC114774343 n=1 Tax=Denticeps clupeoides TaxID=299321 RepID=UPI0010A49BEA|nr:uncharacterized protein LOC114774343 [Denticeps clupeoides]